LVDDNPMLVVQPVENGLIDFVYLCMGFFEWVEVDLDLAG
jgi:hypothetical protein